MIGETVSHYRITRQLGAGGMGIVYEAQDLDLQRTVALKFLPPESTRDPEAKARFLHEARAASALDHPNVCNIHEIGETGDGQLFLVMACYQGETLKDAISRGLLPLAEALVLARQLAEGLAAAHEQGIVHRDIKPGNVFVTASGLVKILDFGLAKLSRQPQLTKPGTTLGTASYLSPEQVRGESVDHRCDVWCLGVSLYEMVTGRLPFPGEYAQAVVYGIMTEDPQPVTALRAGVPLDLDRIITKCLAKNPNERYQHLDDFLVDLRAVENQVTSGIPTATPVATGNRGKRAGMILAVVALAVVAAWLGRSAILRPVATDGSGTRISAVAVLPFENLMGDEAQEYLVQGMHDALITDLSILSGLKVISRTSVMRYRSTEAFIPEIAAELNVDGVIEGSVLRVGGRLRISVRLIEAASDRQFWAQSYERDVTEVLDLQRQIATAIVGEINASLVPAGADAANTQHVVAPAAVEAYMLGRHFWNRRGTNDVRAAIGHFRRATEIDPAYAAAYAGLADCYAILAINNSQPPSEYFPLARNAAQKALELNGELAEAYVSMAYVSLYCDRDWAAAERAYERAIELNPNSAAARQWYAMLMEATGRFEDARAEMERARQLDPLSPLMLANVARRQAMARDYDLAMATAQRALAMDPHLLFTQILIAEIHLWRRDLGGHARQIVRILEDNGESPAYGQALLAAYESGGATGYWEARIRLDRAGIPQSVSRHTGGVVAVALGQLGRMDEAFKEIEAAVEDHQSYVIWLKVNPLFDVFKSDPRYNAMLRRIGLAP